MLVVSFVTLVKEDLFSDVKNGIWAYELCFHALPQRVASLLFFSAAKYSPFIHNGDTSDMK